jgi:hypothetical protein
MHLKEFRQIVRDAEIANAISSVVRRHRLTEEETEEALLELRIPRAANVARISVSLGLEPLTGGEVRTRGSELIGRIAPLDNASREAGQFPGLKCETSGINNK